MSRGRRWAIFLPVVVTVLLAGVVGALIVVQNQARSDRVAAADTAGEAFLSDVGMFRGGVARQLREAGAADPAALRQVLQEAVADPPNLADVPDDAAGESDVYAAAVATAKTFLGPYTRLRTQLRRAEISLTFIAAARAALELRASDYVGFGLLEDSAVIRSRLIPAFVTARDTFAAVRVPKGQDELAVTVRGAVQYVIDRATTLADSIDANRSFSFTYADQFRAAAAAVDDYATTVGGDVTEAINAVAG